MNKLCLIGLLLVAFLAAEAKEVPPRPSDFRYVYDEVGLLNANEIRALQQRLSSYENATSTQIAIVVERSLEGEEVADYSVRLAHEWKIGQKDKDNGVLIYVSVDDKKIGLATGYGAESFLTDAMATRIRTQVLAPGFRQGKYYDSFNQAISAIQELAGDEFVNDRASEKRRSRGGVSFGIILLFFIIFMAIIIMMNRSSGHGDDEDDDGGYYRGGRYDEHPRRNRRHSRGGGWIFIPGFGGGSGSFGGDSGDFGGFGDFGGGDFGGGGSFGDW